MALHARFETDSASFKIFVPDKETNGAMTHVIEQIAIDVEKGYHDAISKASALISRLVCSPYSREQLLEEARQSYFGVFSQK